MKNPMFWTAMVVCFILSSGMFVATKVLFQPEEIRVAVAVNTTAVSPMITSICYIVANEPTSANKEANTKSLQIGELKPNEKYVAKKVVGVWYFILMPDKSIGYVLMEEVDTIGDCDNLPHSQ